MEVDFVCFFFFFLQMFTLEALKIMHSKEGFVNGNVSVARSRSACLCMCGWLTCGTDGK